jgi:D-tyrosyl-tRNA(Tyr) deacylase
MRAVIQRVSSGSVEMDKKVVGSIGRGLVILLGVGQDDSYEDVRYLADKICVLRVFEDENGKMNLSAQDVNAEILVISQFTLYADCRKGRRPSFTDAAEPRIASTLYETFVGYLRESGFKVETGEFGAHMLVSINNDGPVTLMLDSEDRKGKQ